MDYFQCHILLVGSLFKLVLSPAQQCTFFTCTYTFQFRMNWNQLDTPILFFSHCSSFSLHGDFRSANEWPHLVWLPKHGPQLPRWITSLLSAPSQECRWVWELPFHQIPVCHSGRIWVSLWTVQANEPTSSAAWIFTVLQCPDILLLLQAQKSSYFCFFQKWEGKSSSFLFFYFCAMPLTCGCFMGEAMHEWSRIVRPEIGPHACHRRPSSCRCSWSPAASVKWGERDLCDRAPTSVHEAEVPQRHGMTVLLHSQLQPWPPMGFGISFFFRTFPSCTCLLT